MRVPLTAIAAALTLSGLTIGTADSAAGKADPAGLNCKLAGVRYVGTGASRGKVCFTLTANGRTMKENAVEPCSAARDVVTSVGRTAKAVAVKANGTFSTTRRVLAIGASGDLGSLEWMNVTFSGRIQGARASSSLVLEGSTSGHAFRCAWSARRSG
jgi:hypothetical protein